MNFLNFLLGINFFEGCYFCYELHKELTAIYRGDGSHGAKDSFFVSLMSAEFWGPPPGCAAAEERRVSLQEDRGGNGFGARMAGLGAGGSDGGANIPNWGSGTVGDNVGSRPANFNPFMGTGRRLGGTDETAA